ncbi:MAG TPA: tetratricopeptide repeat protein [Nitrospirae bacterium]|nr:tetratricopeptide repeat protein [Nitrospirota bacterium]
MVKTIKRNKNKRKPVVHINTGFDHTDLTRMLEKAIRLHQSGNLANAELLYRQILLTNHNHADALHLLGVLAHQTGKNSLAVEYIEKAITINPSMAHYHNNLGNAFLNLNQTDSAVRCFLEALRIKSDYVEAYNNMGNTLKKMGEGEKAIDHYMKAMELNPDYVPAINNLANLLKDQGELDEAIVYYRKAITLKPDLAEAYFNLGNAFKESDKFDDAVEQYYKAISINPDFADVHNNLGNVLKKKRMYDEAVKHYNRAINLNPGLAEAYNNLGDAYKELGKFDEAVELSQKAVHIKPDFDMAYVNLGNIFLAQGNFSGAVEQYQKAIDLSPDLPDAHFNKGLVLLMKGELEEGWKEYQWRFKSTEISQQIGYRDLGIPVWDGSPLEGRTILIKSEQGIGDQIQFARYIPLVKARGGRVLFECHKELMLLFEGYKGIDKLLERPYSSDCGEIPDVCIQLLDLPGIFGTNVNTIFADVPYLKVGYDKNDKWKSRIDGELFKVGLVWAGNSAHTNDRNRSCKLSDFAPLASIPGIAFFSLQKDGMSENGNSLQVADLGKNLGDFCDTAAIIENLDIVISVDTSVAHLAGALGKPVWTLLPFIPDWRWMLDREDTPWYPTMRLFRQPKHGDWKSVFNKIAKELEEYLSHLKLRLGIPSPLTGEG